VRILICTLEAPLPPIDGLRLQVGALVRELRREHDVRVLSLVRPEQIGRGGAVDPAMRLVTRPSSSRWTTAASLPWAILRERPHSVDRLAGGLRSPLGEEVRRFEPDVVHVTSGPLAGLGTDLAGTPAVMAALDAWHLNTDADVLAARGLRRLLLRGEASRVRRFESAAFRPFDTVVVVSGGDRDALHALDPSLRIAVIPNGVDTERFAPDPTVSKEPERIAFTGVMDYAPNETAAEFLAREVLPLVRARCPGAHLVLVGRSPSAKVRGLEHVDGVRVVGEVPEMRPWLAGSAAYVCPMRSGTGIKNKLLEAMACGVPCVASTLAVRGTRIDPGRHALVGDTPSEIADGVVRLLENTPLAGAVGRAGRAYVTEEHSWAAVGRAYVAVYEGAIERARELTER
jgi:glycosyltransferase involved in cell wall biosynthesis